MLTAQAQRHRRQHIAGIASLAGTATALVGLAGTMAQPATLAATLAYAAALVLGSMASFVAIAIGTAG